MSENIGLFVYGGLLMALSFVVGLTTGDHLTMGLSLAGCASAALAHVVIEVANLESGAYAPKFAAWLAILASLASWLVTAAAFVSALIALI